ncbi:hypothetical protein KUTeg_021540 [Tegillarca granosa]|uniref:Uncharacterized protein n=1 Tax=Tegillarca granosa TaxID=220873 RepID=A0ABQ9E3K2_TEGGR|nr:hypothetical protein KUTeg_021540 [Tegillarca granosa]
MVVIVLAQVKIPPAATLKHVLGDVVSYFIQIFVLVNGEWEDWSSWSECSKTCDLGYRERSRTCNIALYGGQPCVGDNAQLDECYIQPCSSKFQNLTF